MKNADLTRVSDGLRVLRQAFDDFRHGGVSMLDFLRYAAAFFFFGQQYYEWRERV